MNGLALLAWLAAAEHADLWRRAVVELAAAQVERPDPAWNLDQRDCAGLVRFVYKTAFARMSPKASERLFLDASGTPIPFADAETLITHSFERLGRHLDRRRPMDGDLLAFRHESGPGGAPVFHLMIYVRAPGGDFVVYHPGVENQPVRVGRVRELLSEAPAEWRPVPENPGFLGAFGLTQRQGESKSSAVGRVAHE
ncbi:MAG: DUF1175 family protein [Deltaproteobacteria bacterium]|nr:DUF1175 family protein [Deltaproteobacteria bacterium]